ncbi:MAG: hypothetical protein AB1324_02930 [Candidatus Micrarchaeota archaeon]
MAQLALATRNDKKREPAPFPAMQPLLGKDNDATIFSSLARLGRDISGRVKGVARAVRAPERELLETPLPPEAVSAVYGPMFFKMKQ